MEQTAVGFIDFDSMAAMPQEDALQLLLNSFPAVGLQASEAGKARRLVQSMLYRRQEGERVFLSYTSNLVSCGLRDMFVYLAKERLVDGVISTAGGIEEDVIKCLGDTYLGRYDLDGKDLRRQGINRIGNLLVPNDNYCDFEDLFTPALQELHQRQRDSLWEEATAPSDYIAAMGKALAAHYPAKCEESLVFWCYKNDIPVFSPALTDGSMGDMIFFYNFSKKGLVVDPIKDVLKLRQLGGTRNSAIVLGAGLPKHHLLTNISMDRVVCVTTGIEADGCTSSCTLEDDHSMGLLRPDTEVVRVQGDATFVFPLLAAKF